MRLEKEAQAVLSQEAEGGAAAALKQNRRKGACMLDVLYFGCIDRPGHYLWASVDGVPARLSRGDYRRGLLNRFDGLLCPTDRTEGVVLKHFIHEHTAISFWDQSGDSRRGSSSTFFLKGIHGYQYMFWAAREAFPTVFARIAERFSLQVAERA